MFGKTIIGVLCVSIFSVNRALSLRHESNVAQVDDPLFPVSIIHINDFHAR